ncbi:protein NLP2-like isoform X1 [Primulina tabacum]|uniref:protein NLP2-like isoform X1 n=1 Tax=Primulina tabacum TaxID=48773 RepID=UPI003F5AD0B7
MMEEFGFTAVDFNLMDQLLYDGFWLETQTADGSNFWQPISTHHLTSPSFIFPASDNIGSWNTNPSPDNILKQTQTSDLFLNYPLMDHHLSHSSESTVPPGSLNNPDMEMNTKSWVGTNRNPVNARAPISVRKRLDEAIKRLKDSVKDKNVLIQIWFPVKKDGGQVLVTNNQPFSLDSNCKNLVEYRDVSRNYQFAADEESKEFVGLPSRVFLKKLPEWTPDVRFFKREEYPRVNHAQQYNVRGSLALPVFELGSRRCLGVVEIVTTTQKLNYRPELENIGRALQAVDLKSFDVPSPPRIEGCDESYQSALADIRNVVKYVCSVHELPLAQTWAPCTQHIKQGCRHSDENYARCVSTIDSACFVADPQVSGFHEACSEHHLLKGEGIPGKAFMSNKPCFSEDVTAFSKTDYPLSHHARVFNLCSAVAIRLRSTYTGNDDFVLEFFLPLNCKDPNDQKMMLDSLLYVIQQTCQSLRVLSHQELAQETSDKETSRTKAGMSYKENWPNFNPSRSEEPSQNASSWIMNVMDSQQKGEGVSVSFDDDNKEESGGEFRVTTEWDNPEDVSPSGGHLSLDGKANKKRRTKTEKTISLQVIGQYFAGSLKDAAKSIGVCPTTLKRICRQHGITRWPSRKIKKVDHSLKKLQLVMDSVQGAEGPIKLGSFYSNFPEFASPKLPVNTSNMNTQTTSKSPSSSSSHSSSSSYCLSTGVKQSSLTLSGDALSTEQIIDQGMLKRARSDAELPHFEAPPVPQNSSRQAKDNIVPYRIKATFGDEKIRFSLHPNWSFNDLKEEVLTRFNVENVGNVDIKYLDDDAEWVLLTCDADLDECVDIHRSSKTRTIKITVIDKAYNQSLGSSFGSNK